MKKTILIAYVALVVIYFQYNNYYISSVTLHSGIQNDLFQSTSAVTQVIFRPEGTIKEQSSCRYGPGAAYLFEWGLYPGDFVWIINRNNDGSWLYVKPDSFRQECWVKADLLNIKGDVNSLSIIRADLPRGYLYKPVHYIIAKRVGEEIHLQWEAVWMTEDDDRGYLIEAWICRDNRLVFQPIGVVPYTNNHTTVIDEAGCRNRSYAHIYTVEKHGYIFPWTEIPWPEIPKTPIK